MPIRLTKLKFLFLPLLAAAVVSALLWLLFLRQQLPYNLDLVYRAMNAADEIGPMRLYYYHDFENDGISEFVGLGSDALRTDENKTNSVQIFSSDKRPIDQFLVKGTIANLEYPFFADINQDGVDEVIVATVANDSIFFSIIDRKNLSYLLRDQFVLERTYFRPDHEWGLTVAFSDAIDFDNDGEIEIICNISAGWGLQPRMMAVYDVPEKRIIKYRDLPYTQPYYTFYDLNQDGEPEYILNGGYAMANMLEKNGQHDWTAWLHYLDKDLNPLRPPLQGGSEYSAFRALPILYENEPALFVIHFINSPMQTWLRIYNSNFQEICQRVFPNARIWSSKARVGVKHNSSILKEPVKTPIVLTQQSGNNYELIKVDLNLDVIDRVSFASGKKIMGDNIFANFPSEKVNSFILQTTRELFIYDDNMQIIAKWERPEDLNKPLAGLSLRARADGSYRIVASAPDLIELDVLPNRIFAWRYFLLAGAFFGLFGAVFFANRMVANSRENHQIGQMMLVHTRIGVAKITKSGEIGSFNPALLRLLEIPEPAKNERIETVFTNYPDLQQSINNAMKSDDPMEQKIVEKPQLSVRLSPIESTGNWFLEIFPETDRNAETQLRIWSATARQMTHDIKTPLAAIRMRLELLKAALADANIQPDSPVDGEIQRITDELKRVQDITKDFLKFANLEAPNLQLVSVAELLQQAVEQFRSYINPELQIRLPNRDDLPEIRLDRQQMLIVCHIILENAIAAMQGKGIITIECNIAEYPEHRFRKYLEIECHDSGPGMDDSVAAKAFEPFFTTKSDGTGMGLVIAKKIVEDHNGIIAIDSRKGLGTTVRIALPMEK